jgi:hypothetical protein
MALTKGFADGQGSPDRHITVSQAAGPQSTGNYSAASVGDGSASSSANDGAARYISPPGVTRQGRIGNIATEAAAGATDYNVQDAFIDGDDLSTANMLKPPIRNQFGTVGLPTDVTAATSFNGDPVPNAAVNERNPSVSGDGSGFPGIDDATYYPTGGQVKPVPRPAPVVNKSASQRGGGQPTQPAPSNAPGFPGLP